MNHGDLLAMSEQRWVFSSLFPALVNHIIYMNFYKKNIVESFCIMTRQINFAKFSKIGENGKLSCSIALPLSSSRALRSGLPLVVCVEHATARHP